MILVPYYLWDPSPPLSVLGHGRSPRAQQLLCPLVQLSPSPASCFLKHIHPPFYLVTIEMFLKHKIQLPHSHVYNSQNKVCILWHCMPALHDLGPAYWRLLTLTQATPLQPANDVHGQLSLPPLTGPAPSCCLPLHILFSQPGAHSLAPRDNYAPSGHP